MLKVFICGPIETNAYLLESDGEVVAIDPAPGSAEYLKSASRVLVTHSHWDHIADCAELGLPVWVHADDAENVRKPGSDGLVSVTTPMAGVEGGEPKTMTPFEGVEPDHLLEDGEKIQVGALELEVLHTPGHSPGSVCFYCPQEGFVIVGDLVFRGGYGRLDLPTGEPERMPASLERIGALPPETIIYSGHGPETTVQEEILHGCLSR